MAARVLPTLPSWAAGQRVLASELQQITTWGAFKDNPPMFRMYQTATQSLSSGADTQITMDAVAAGYDTDSGRGGSTPWSYTIPIGMSGRWRFTVAIAYASNATGLRVAAVRINGAAPTSRAYVGGAPVNGNLTVVTVTVTLAVNAGDVISAYGYQSSGGSLSTYSDTNITSFFEGSIVSLGNP